MTKQDNYEYQKFLESKKVTKIESGFDVDISQLSPLLFLKSKNFI